MLYNLLIKLNVIIIMKKTKILSLVLLPSLILTASCARDLSSNMYTTDSTMNLTLEGKVISVRNVTLKESDRLGNNSGGMVAGGLAGGVAGGSAGNGSSGGVILGALVGAAAGAVVQDSLSTTQGFEYIVKVDPAKIKYQYYEGSPAMRAAISSATTSGLITIVQQDKESAVKVDQNVYVIFSDNRTRIIPAN